MNLLVLGGTLFLGRHLVDAALGRGHRVTLFNRGRAGPGLFPDVERLRGDRDGGLGALDGRRWDAVIDTSGYVPRIVHASATLLAPVVGTYVFVSSASVYEDLDTDRIDESAATKALDDPSSESIAEHYGALKAACERAVEAALPDRALHVRAGLIVGPWDATGRFEYWVRRMPEGGEILAPGRPERRVQLIDARDLAEWTIARCEAATVGVYNVTGPAGSLTMADLLAACGPGDTGRLTWVDDAFLTDREVTPFSDLPFWLPAPYNGLLSLDIGKAVGDGLRCRDLRETVADTRRWLAGDASSTVRPATLASGVRSGAGLDRERERALLAAWHASEASKPA